MFSYRRTAAAKARAKQLAESLMTQTCDIHRPTGSLAVDSVYEETMAIVATGVACRIVAAGGTEFRSHAVNPAGENKWIFHFPASTDVRLGDLVLFNGVRYQLESDSTRHTEAPYELRFVGSSLNYDGYPAHV